MIDNSIISSPLATGIMKSQRIEEKERLYNYNLRLMEALFRIPNSFSNSILKKVDNIYSTLNSNTLTIADCNILLRYVGTNNEVYTISPEDIKTQVEKHDIPELQKAFIINPITIKIYLNNVPNKYIGLMDYHVPSFIHIGIPYLESFIHEKIKHIKSMESFTLIDWVDESGVSKDKKQVYKSFYTYNNLIKSLTHELAHWLADSTHNAQFYSKNNKEGFEPKKYFHVPDIDMAHPEIDAVVHVIKSIRDSYSQKEWDSIRYVDLAHLYPSLSEIFSSLATDDPSFGRLKVYIRTLSRRLAREGLLGKSMDASEVFTN